MPLMLSWAKLDKYLLNSVCVTGNVVIFRLYLMLLLGECGCGRVCVPCVDVPVGAMEVSTGGLPQWLSILHLGQCLPLNLELSNLERLDGHCSSVKTYATPSPIDLCV